MFCTVCATPNPLAAGRCRSCGTGLREPAAGRRTEPRGKARRLVVLGLYGVPLLVALVTGIVWYRSALTGPAAWYARAAAAEAAGRYPEALTAYAAARDHRDAHDRHVAVAAAFAPLGDAYEAAAIALDAGHHDEAVALVAPVVRALPGYEAAALLLADARRLRAEALHLAADAAEGRRDWLAAERALAELAAADPTDTDLTVRLATLRRAHAPLVFARDRALWLVGPDGADERLLTDALPAAWPTWSPDRSRVAFTSSEPGGGGIALYVVNVDGTGLTRLASDLRPYAGPVWSPDGTRIAFAVEGGWADRANQTAPDPPGVRVVEVATGRIVDVSGGRVRDALYPSWSPAGDRLAFVSRDPDSGGGFDPTAPGAGWSDAEAPPGEVYVATLATGTIVNVSEGRVRNPWRVAWSPTDDRLLVYTRDPGMSYDRDRARVVLLDARTGALTAVPTGGQRITMPVWAPDGERIAYVAGEGTVMVHDLDGGARRVPLDAMISRFLAWSPDGSALVAVAEGAGRSSYLVPLPVDAGASPAAPEEEPRPLTLEHDVDRRQAGAPQWGPTHPVPPLGPFSVAGTGLDPA